MNITIDKSLRELRSARGNTQEELANHLGVSVQAVSKWERGETMPDITFLPQIAAYYDVSVDDLLGVGEIRRNGRIKELEEESVKLRKEKRMDENLKLWRKAYKEFPNELKVVYHLMFAIRFTKWDNPYSADEAHELISLAERILNESIYENVRRDAMHVLCQTYNDIGNKEKAIEYAIMLGNIWTSGTVLLMNIYKGEERKWHDLNTLLYLLNIISKAEIGLCMYQDYERYLWLHEFYLKIMELYFDDGFYGKYACHAVIRHLWLARIYHGVRNDEQKTYEHLKEAVRFAKQYDELPEKYVYTSTLLNGLEDDRNDIGRGSTGTEGKRLLDDIRDSHFDCVRDTDWFKEIEQELLANIAE